MDLDHLAGDRVGEAPEDGGVQLVHGRLVGGDLAAVARVGVLVGLHESPRIDEMELRGADDGEDLRREVACPHADLRAYGAGRREVQHKPPSLAPEEASHEADATIGAQA